VENAETGTDLSSILLRQLSQKLFCGTMIENTVPFYIGALAAHAHTGHGFHFDPAAGIFGYFLRRI
jgi:hypothetical protein